MINTIYKLMKILKHMLPGFTTDSMIEDSLFTLHIDVGSSLRLGGGGSRLKRMLNNNKWYSKLQ